MPGDREHVVARDPLAIVTYIPSVVEPDGSGLANAHRVCLLQNGRFTTVSTGSSDFSGAQIQRDFTLSGRWLAWLDQEYAEAVSYPQIELLDLAHPRSPPRAVPAFGGASVEEAHFALSPVGTVAWIAVGDYADGEGLYVLGPVGPPALLATGPTGSLRNLAINPSGTDVTWTQAGASEAAAVP